ncbi:MAG: RodZ domain-containing protein, partial [Pseudomonadota bacterium]
MSDTETRPERLRGFDSYEVTLGDVLRGERATKGKSLLDVQRDLRIKAAYISAIENADADVFPNPGFIAGYVRSYARYLELDPEEVYAQFCATSGFGGVNSDLSGIASKAETAAKRLPQRPALQDDVLKRSRLGTVVTGEGWHLGDVASGLGSLAVLGLLIGALGYGAWFVLEEVQRVRIAPVAQTPSVGDQPVEVVTPLALSGAADPVTSETGTDTPEDTLARLYRPQELAIPDFEPRDGPIAALNPEDVGIYPAAPRPRAAGGEPAFGEMPLTVAAAAEPEPTPLPVPAGPPVVRVTADQAAWIRVYQPDGTVIFEKILDPGETYELPEGLEAPLLRAGNSGAVYLSVNEAFFGPLGNGPRVVKDVQLTPEAVQTGWPRLETGSPAIDALEDAVARRSA